MFLKEYFFKKFILKKSQQTTKLCVKITKHAKILQGNACVIALQICLFSKVHPGYQNITSASPTGSSQRHKSH